MRKLIINSCWWLMVIFLWIVTQIAKLLSKLGSKKIRLKKKRKKMPFKSQQQRKFMYAKKPKLAKEFESKTKKGAKLPKKVTKKKK